MDRGLMAPDLRNQLPMFPAKAPRTQKWEASAVWIPNVENEGRHLFEPEIPTPEQMADGLGGQRGSQPERRLMAAVLEDAIFTYERYAGDDEESEREIFREVERWLHSSDSHWLFSFERICETLGLEPTAVRRTIARSAQASRCARRPVQRRRRPAGDRHAIGA
ncbi:MAG: hypothetical protein FJ144_19995 [Deltaproteobacteria bacterium]|nr:hypothetical protein [Deltaproteobacteria bacterium]